MSAPKRVRPLNCKPLYVMYHRYIDSAMAGSDYLSLDNAQIIIPAGSSEDAISCINISIVDDDEFEQEELARCSWWSGHLIMIIH